MLLRADYYRYGGVGAARPGHPLGPGETVRLDYVAVASKDPYFGNETQWGVQDMEAFIGRLELFRDSYGSAFLVQYIADYRLAIKLSICSGNGVRDSATGLCVCDTTSANEDGGTGWIGADCTMPCPTCFNGTCVPR